jgi:hypothetical protein
MSKIKKPTKKEIKRMAELLIKFQEVDENYEYNNRLYIALNTRLHKQAIVETVLSECFGLNPF